MTTTTPPPLTGDQETALGRLAAVIADHLDHGRPVPCRAHQGKAPPWIADRPADHAAAARACRHCPALTACHAYAQAFAEPAGVWGATTPADRAKARRQTKSAA